MAAAIMAVAALAGCATYKPLPLPQYPASYTAVSQLRGEPPAGTWDMPTIERLVLLNNPALRTVRAQHHMAQAQMQQAGLLPNPVVGGSAGFLLSGPGDATAWTASISEDITALVTLHARREAARADAGAIDAGLLWQEWQTIAQARLLAIDIIEGERLLQQQRLVAAWLEQRSQHVNAAVAEGLMDRATAAGDLTAAADTRASVDDLQQHLLDLHQQLTALLGLAPNVALPLPATLDVPALDEEAIRHEADDIAQRRPDLVALQLGYQSQEASLHAMVLAQFPGLSLGYATSSDNSRVYNGGPSVSFTLPLFDRNQGNIAAAKATREQLQIEYSTRIAGAHDDVNGLLAQYDLATQQRQALVASHDDNTAKQADGAWRDGQIDLHAYADLQLAALVDRSRLITLEQAQLERQAALETLVGRGMPTTLPQEILAP